MIPLGSRDGYCIDSFVSAGRTQVLHTHRLLRMYMEIRVVVSNTKSEPIAPHLVQSFSGNAVVNTSAPNTFLEI
jgi:hypothetical protein